LPVFFVRLLRFNNVNEDLDLLPPHYLNFPRIFAKLYLSNLFDKTTGGKTPVERIVLILEAQRIFPFLSVLKNFNLF